MSATPVLRPLGVGEILDAALAVYRRNAFALWKLVAVVVALPAALTGVVAVAAHQVDANGAGTEDGSLLLLTAATQLVGLLATFLATAAAYRLVADAYLGRAVDPQASLRFGMRRFGSVLWVSILAGVALVIAFFLLVIPFIYLAVSWSVAVPVLLGENLRGRRALGRSHALVRGRWWSCLGVLVLAVVLAIVVLFALEFVVALIIGSTDNELVIFLDRGVASLITDTLVLPFQVAVLTVLYIDLRVRKEGFDVQLLAHSLEPGGAGET